MLYCNFFVQNIEVGLVSEVHPLVQERLGIPYRVGMLEMNLTVLINIVNLENIVYKPLPTFPSVVRDMAFLVAKSTSHYDIVNTVRQANQLIQNVEMFDAYEGNKIQTGKKSLAYHITYQSFEKTLTAEEVSKAHGQVAELLKNKFWAEIR